MLDGGNGACARTAVVSGNNNMVGLGFGNACGHRSHARFAHELDRNIGLAVGALEVMDELRQIFDRIDVVLRRRRN